MKCIVVVWRGLLEDVVLVKDEKDIENIFKKVCEENDIEISGDELKQAVEDENFSYDSECSDVYIKEIREV